MANSQMGGEGFWTVMSRLPGRAKEPP